MARIGQFIDGKYEILKLIGKGGMSEVYLAMDKDLNKQWAIKEIKKRARDKNNELVIQSAIAEADMIKNLDHPSIVRIVGIKEEDDVIYIIEDYVEGQPLNDVIKRQGPQSQEDVIDWAIQICKALDYLHTRNPSIIYRDMKPANVMLKPDGTIKVIDFGIAREYNEYRKGDTVNLGTKGYAAPEQYDRDRQTDARTDIYCLGVTLYHLLTGKDPSEPPYEVLPIRQINPQLSVGLESIILKCTKPNPKDRYQSCSELLYALENYHTLDTVYINKQKAKLKKFLTSSLISIVSFALGCGALVLNSNTINEKYKELLTQGQQTANVSEKINYFSEAIDVKPKEKDAYFAMIEAMSDGKFDKKEEAIILDKIKSNNLTSTDYYGDLAYEFAKLYWYYYEDQSDATRAKFSLTWFSDSIDYPGADENEIVIATVYKDIATFITNIDKYVNEASDNGKYIEFWSNLESLDDLINSSNSPELVRLTVNNLIVNQIETRSRKFKSDGVTRTQIDSLYDSVYNNIENIEATSDTTKDLKTKLLNKKGSVYQAIENAYREVNQ